MSYNINAKDGVLTDESWDDIPEHLNFAAQHSNGWWSGFEGKPWLSDDHSGGNFIWMHDPYFASECIGKTLDPARWMESLQSRPET